MLRRPLLFAVPAVVWMAVFFVAPFILLILFSFWRIEDQQLVREFGLQNYERILGQGPYAVSVLRSIQVALVSTLLSCLVAYPVAYLLAFKVQSRLARLFLVLALLPFWTSYLVRSYSWLLVLGQSGVVNTALLNTGLISEPLKIAYTKWATIIGFVHFFSMLMLVTIFAALVKIPKSYRLAAADLGASAVSTFVRVILPLSAPGLLTGAFLCFVLAIGDFATPQILGGGQEMLLSQTAMLFMQRNFDYTATAAASVIMMGLILIVYLVIGRWLRLERI